MSAPTPTHGRSGGEETPLHNAAKRNKNPEPIIDALVNAGADLSAEDKWGRVPLDLAAYLGNTPATTALVKAISGAGLRKTFGITPLHEAALSEEADAVSSLVRRRGRSECPLQKRHHPPPLGGGGHREPRRHR